MQLTIREPGSAITHFIACLMALMAASPLMIKAQGNTTNMLAMAVFAGSMILLYGASTAYHSISRVSDKVLRIFRKIDHMMIFVLIAGSYTPVCLIVLGGRMGYSLLALVWGTALVGMIVKACWITCPKWFSSVILSRWAGPVFWYSALCGIPCPTQHSAGYWQAASFIQSEALSMH